MMCSYLVTLLTLLALSSFAVTDESTKEGEPCVVDGEEYAIGEQRDIPGHCGLNVCDGGDKWTQGACGILAVPEGWSATSEDPSKPFPDCCSHAVPPDSQ